MSDESIRKLAALVTTALEDANRVLAELRPRLLDRQASYRGQRFVIQRVFNYGAAVNVSGCMIKQNGAVGHKVVGGPLADVELTEDANGMAEL
jgi:hypothetical protein